MGGQGFVGASLSMELLSWAGAAAPRMAAVALPLRRTGCMPGSRRSGQLYVTGSHDAIRASLSSKPPTTRRSASASWSSPPRRPVLEATHGVVRLTTGSSKSRES
jgi:hypothetical protein